MTIVLLVSQAGNVGKTTFAKKVATELKKRNKKLKWTIINLRMFPTMPRIRTGATNSWVGKVGGEYVKHLSDLGWLIFVEGRNSVLKLMPIQMDYAVWLKLSPERAYKRQMERASRGDKYHDNALIKFRSLEEYMRKWGEPEEANREVIKKLNIRNIFYVDREDKFDEAVKQFAEIVLR
jgi:molybdopterin-guanine dinucleotide biosynthesis protein